MIAKSMKKLLASMLAFILVFTAIPATAFGATTYTLLDGKVTVSTEDSSNVTNSGETITATAVATSSTSCGSTTWSAGTTTFTVTNSSEAKGILQFSYAAEGNVDSLTIGGTTYTGSGIWSSELDAGATVEVALTSTATENAVATVSLSSFSITDTTPKTVTVKAPVNGTVTVKGTAITDDTTVSATYTEGVAVAATPASGYEFIGWVDETNNLLSSAVSATLKPTANCTVTAVFVQKTSTQGYYKVGSKLFDNLSAAITQAANGSAKTIVPVRNATVPKGTYIIPAGVTLLIPFDAADTCYTAEPAYAGTTWTTPTAYRKLTLADGATILVNGALSVSAKHAVGAGGSLHAGSPTGPCGFMELQSGSNLIINKGGAAYVWGYITGSGQMTAKSGSSVYENMQITDFRGGTDTMAMLNGKAFPFSQYYIQNVEAPLTLEAGAAEYAYTTLTALNQTMSTTIQFIGSSNAMFTMSTGTTVTKQYNPSRDRLELTVNGDIAVNSITLNAMGMNVNSGSYNLPITNNITINVNSGKATMNQDIALQPGVEVYIAEGAELNVASGKNLYVYDAEQWGAYVHGGNQFIQVRYSPTRSYTRTVANDIKDVIIDVNGTLSGDGAIYTTSSGANITSSQEGGIFKLNSAAGTATSTEQATTGGTAVSIPITAAKLKNADGTFTATAGNAAGTAYTYKDGKWVQVADATITYNANGGTGTMSAQTVSKADILAGKSTTLTANRFTREGYTFTGWNTKADGSGKAYADGATAKITADATLYAQWEINQYTITFDTAGGSTIAPITANYGAAVTAPANPTREGYTFTGWDKEIPATMPDGDITITAQWEVNSYTVTFDNNGADIPVEGAWSIPYGSSLTEGDHTLPEPGRTGYEFAGWVVVNADGTTEAAPAAMPAKDLTLRAEWEAIPVTLTVYVDDVEVSSQTLTYKDIITLPENPTKEGYTFVGWIGDDGITYETGMEMPYYSLSVWAQWEINQYTVTFKDGDHVISTKTQDYGTAIEVPAEPTKEGYTFVGWSPEVAATIPAKDVTYTAQWEINQYTITFDTDGGNTVAPIKANYGAAITAPADPTKEGHTFLGWDKEIPATMPAGDMTIKAMWEVNEYTITFDAAGGSEVEPITQDYGTAITAPKAPTREGYTFKGWSPALPETMPAKNMELKAQWEINQYTITFDTAGGSKVDAITADFGSEITKPADPTREGYTFAGWDKEIPANMPAGDMTITAKWTINQYTIEFDAAGGSEVASITQDYNSEITKPADPTREGYTFAGWDVEIPAKMPAKDMKITAQWTINQYTIDFDANGGSEVADITADYDSVITKPADPTREGYTFLGWDKEIPVNMPAEDMKITAQWQINQYTITFETDGGTEVEAITQDYGTAITEPEEPVKAGFTFAGWSMEVPKTMPAENLTLVAQWNAKKEVTIVFEDVDGTEIDVVSGLWGQEFTAPEDPTKEGYTFVGWDPEVPERLPEHNTTYTAVWDAIEYTITFDTAGGSAVDAITADYGTAITAPAEPTREGYTFVGWDTEIPAKMPAGDLTITALWEINQYTISFDTAGGSKVDSITADYGAEITTIPAEPVREGYTFAGWDTELPKNMPAEDMTITAQWTANTYTITFDTAGGSEIAPITAEYGSEITPPADPTREAYLFLGWDKEIPKTMPAGDMTITAQWKLNEFTITFDTLGGTEIEPMKLAVGAAVTAPADPTREGYTFLGWDAEIPETMPNHDVTTYAKWQLNQYTITFDTAGGSKVASITGDYGSKVEAPADPTREGYAFTGWDKEIPETIPAGDMTITAQWDAIEYTITFESAGGSKVDPITADCGTAITTPADPTREGYAFTGWEPAVPEIMPAEDVTVTAQWKYNYTGWKITDEGTTYFENGNKAYEAEWAEIEGAKYYFDEDGYVLKGVAEAEDSTYIFDAETGALTDTNGLYDDGTDIYLAESGKVVEYAGLVVIGEDFYYFDEDNTAARSESADVIKTNDLLPEGTYDFDKDGKMINVPKTISNKTIVLAEDQVIYDGTAKKPEVTIEGLSEENFDVTYKKNKNPGIAQVIVTGKNGYYGQIETTFTIVLDAPVIKAGNVASSGKIKIAWGAVKGADKYVVYRATSEDGEYQKMYTTSNRYYTNTSAEAGKTYWYKVIAVYSANTDANSDYSNVVSRTCDLAMPTNLKTGHLITGENGETWKSGKNMLSWKAVEGAEQYVVYRATKENGTYKKMFTTKATEYTNTSAIAGKTYWYKVRAIDLDNDNAYSALSKPVKNTCKLARPTNIKLTNDAKTGKIRVTWDAVKKADKYIIYRASSKDGIYKQLYTTTKTSYLNTSAKAGNMYYYKVRAVYSANEDANSLLTGRWKRTCDLARPVVKASNVASTGKVKLTWKKISGADKYKVYRATSKNGEYKLIKTTTATSFVHAKGKAATTYWYKVKAIDADNSAANSAYSTVVKKACK